MKPIRILIADDHQLIREGIASLIRDIEDFKLIGQVSTGEQLIDILTTIDELPDICITDLEMPGMGGIAAIKQIRQKFPSVKILVVSMHDEPFYINRAVKEGADGYLLKSLNRELLTETIKKLLEGKQIFTNTSKQVDVVEESTSHNSLTAREKQILRMIAEGMPNKLIAKELCISNRTVDTHRNNLMRKLNISSSVHLVHYAYANNLV